MIKSRNIKAMWRNAAAAAVMALAAASFAGCGNDSEKAYLDEIDAKDYVKLGEYKGIEVTQADPEVTEEERDSYINYLLTLNPAEGAKDGDTVNIDYVGTLDGVAFEGGTASGQNLTLGSGKFIDGFEEGLVGAKAGETVDLNLTFPAGYQAAELAGKDVVFTVTVNTIMAASPQELTDDYVKGLGIECSTVDEYKQYVYDRMMEDATASYEDKIRTAVVNDLVENTPFKKDPPEAMVERYTETLTANLTAQAASYGVTLDQFMQLSGGMDVEAYTAEIKTQAEKSAKGYIILKAIADAENLNVSDEELDNRIKELAESAGYESVDEFRQSGDDRGYKEYMMGEKVKDMLRENAVVNAE